MAVRHNQQELSIEKRVKRLLSRLGRLWKVPGLEKRISVEFSSRLTRSLGRALPDRRIVRLHAELAQPLKAEFLAEVLCHEAAHVVVRELHGACCRPHGMEWAALVERAGYAARRSIPAERTSRREAERARGRWVYVHRCGVCHAVRYASRPMARWRCVECREAGLDGRLTITSCPRARGQHVDS